MLRELPAPFAEVANLRLGVTMGIQEGERKQGIRVAVVVDQRPAESGAPGLFIEPGDFLGGISAAVVIRVTAQVQDVVALVENPARMVDGVFRKRHGFFLEAVRGRVPVIRVSGQGREREG